jgi:hypothetical protein
MLRAVTDSAPISRSDSGEITSGSTTQSDRSDVPSECRAREVRAAFIHLFLALSPHKMTERVAFAAGLPAPPIEHLQTSEVDMLAPEKDNDNTNTSAIPTGGFRGRAAQREPYFVSESIAGEKTALVLLPDISSAALIDSRMRVRLFSNDDSNFMMRALCPQKRGATLLLGELARGTLHIIDVFALDGVDVGCVPSLRKRLDQLQVCMKHHPKLATFGRKNAHYARRPRLRVRDYRPATKTEVARLLARVRVDGKLVDALERFDHLHGRQRLEIDCAAASLLRNNDARQSSIDVSSCITTLDTYTPNPREDNLYAPVRGLVFTPVHREAHRYRALLWQPGACQKYGTASIYYVLSNIIRV